MAFFSQSGQIFSLGRSTSVMLPVLKLFLLPVGGGIPAGVLLASAKGLAWPITTVLYLVSDMVLALAFEPILRLLAALGKRVPLLARLSVALKAVTARSVVYFSGTGAGPLSLIMIAFGVDPMTGRATALTTLRLNTYFRNPNITMLVVLGAMFGVPILVRYFRSTQSAIN